MSQHGGVFMRGTKQPGAKRLQSGDPLKDGFPETASVRARRVSEGLRLIVPGVALVAAAAALVTSGVGGQLLIFTRLTHGLGHDEIGHVSGLSAPRFVAVLAFTRLIGGIAFRALGERVLSGLEVKEDLLDGLLGLFGKQVALMFSLDPGLAAFA